MHCNRCVKQSPTLANVRHKTHQLPILSSHRTETKISATDRNDAVVLGGGIGGLVAACKLAKAGLSVTVVEQQPQVGGRCQSEVVHTEHGDFRFDTGPSMLLYPHVYKQTFASLGVDMESMVPIKRVEPAAYRVWFEDRTQLELFYDIPQMLNQLDKVEPGAGTEYLKWLAKARTALELGTKEVVERDYDDISTYMDLHRLLPMLGQIDVMDLMGQYHSRLSMHFKDPRLQALFSFQNLYMGTTPYTAPGAFSMLAATELTDGVYYPVGGFSKITDAFVELAKDLGVTFRTNTRVTSINSHTPSGQVMSRPYVTGVQLKGGDNIRADIVVSNRDVPLTYQILDGAPGYSETQYEVLANKQYSAGVIAYNFCVKGTLDKLLHHNVFTSNDFERSWQRATRADELLPRATFYVHCPSRTDPTAAPPGYETMTVLLPVANIQEVMNANKQCTAVALHQQPGSPPDLPSEPDLATPSYGDLIAAGRKVIANAFKQDGICRDFFSQVVYESVMDPVDFQAKYGIMHGAVWGMSHGLDQLALLRPGVKDAGVKGLYMVGASSRPGSGVPMVMVSADLAVKRVMKDLQLPVTALVPA